MECFVCKKKDTSEELFGEMREVGGMNYHHFCLLFCTSLLRMGDEEEDFWGFRCKDIEQEVKSNETNTCYYCDKEFAATACSSPGCEKMFHLPCGTEENCLFNFKIRMAFCDTHTGLPERPPQEFNEKRSCLTCIEPMGMYSPLECIQMHCKPHVWLHRNCLRRFALQACNGLQCLLCRDPKFRDTSQERGVYVPDREIQWMKDDLKKGKRMTLLCSANICSSEIGREFSQEEIVGAFCTTCKMPFHGSCAMYSGQIHGETFTCFGCYGITDLVDDDGEEGAVGGI